MTSILSSMKRKIASILSPTTPPDDDNAASTGPPQSQEEVTATDRPSKRPRLPDPSHPLLETQQSTISISDLVAETSTDDDGDDNDNDDIATNKSLCLIDQSAAPLSSPLLQNLPPDVLSQCLSYLPTRSDRFALQTTCSLFRALSNADRMLVDVDLDGILLPADDALSSLPKLLPYALSHNPQSLHFLGMILCYCHENIPQGLSLLRLAAERGYLPSLYSLSLILRDSHPSESERHLHRAMRKGYIPAWMEKLTAAEMRRKFGDLNAGQLEGYFDPGCLTKLMGRHYLECRRWERGRETSHCWNARCGRWAYKALVGRAEGVEYRWGWRRADVGGVAVGVAVGNGVGNGDNAGDGNGNGGRSRNGDDGEDDVIDDGRIARRSLFSIESLLPPLPEAPSKLADVHASPLGKIRRTLEQASSQLSRGRRRHHCHAQAHAHSRQDDGSSAPFSFGGMENRLAVSRMKMCSSCRRAKYCSKLCQVYDWRSGRHKMECQFL
ncbi:hypothetical protein ACHAXS_013198 [Conticribra weissflogii]